MTTDQTVAVNVTDEDIDVAVEGRIAGMKPDEACPLAIALRRTSGYPHAIVWTESWRALRARPDEVHKHPRSVRLTAAAVGFVRDFDTWASGVVATFRQDPELPRPTKGRPTASSFVESLAPWLEEVAPS